MNNKLLKLLIVSVGLSLFPFTTPVEAQTSGYWFVKYPNSPHIYRVGRSTYCRVQNPSQLIAFRAENKVQIVTSPQLLERKKIWVPAHGPSLLVKSPRTDPRLQR